MVTRLALKLGLAFCTAFHAAPALPQDITWTPDATEACLAEQSDRDMLEVCIGRSAALCIDTPDGYTTVGMSFCANQEAVYWDNRLNAAYQALSAIEAERDAAMAEFGSAAPSMSDALRDMQRAWITFRDASCAYEASQWGGGSGTGPAVLSCRMHITGTQALALEARLRAKKAQ
ncbi:MAG: lysozyme inhibitor LprI family protein [Pseudomonadota bacterium]